MRLQFLFRIFDLAFKLKCPVEEICRLSPLLMAMWEQYFKDYDPERRYDQRFGHLIAEVRNKFNSEKVEPKDFMFFTPPDAHNGQLTDEQYLEFMYGFAAARAGN